ncbi:LysM peptidoglycan-binding domain-containing protein [Anaerotignum lactatifermentans]|uniref:LysM domain-containing protein n=2 Tax=Anaerotignum lactatifermentans TaxID=160404 RepID=A0A1M6MET7_9FIRM|nr:LysM peptidoglycan-binding domain-containing protein [Anaerotignum lactatifermentans]SHJ82032.1 LysM domain-containing protein [[Clostridium] lactatifermentans DSM 14214] [Anaerotignum lactatifermentans DSM 14214]
MEEKDKLENGSQGRSMSDADKEYYADLYNDLPKEVQDILMQTHPLMGRANEDTEAAAYRTRRPQREDVEEVKEARMQQVSSEINEIKRAPQQEGDPTRYVSRRARSMESEYAESPRGSMAEDDYNEDIQYVSVMPARKKSRIMEEVTIQTSAPQKSGMKKKKQKKEREEMPFSDMERSGDRPRYEDIDFEERAKQEHLDSLYGDGYDDDYRGGGRSKLPLILGIVGLVLIVFLIFKTVTLSSQLEEAQQKVTETQDLNEKYEQVQLEKMQLQEELDALQNPDGAAAQENTEGNADDSETTTGDSTSGSDSNTSSSSSGSSSGTTEYTVQQGETPWSMAQKFYGNGAEYTKILEANGLQEGDNIQPGDVLKIPAA